MKISEKLKEIVGEVGAVYKIGSGVVATAVSAVAFVVGSRTLAIVVVVAALLALISAFVVTISVYRGRSKEICLKSRKRYFILAMVGFVLAILTLTIVDPDIAKISHVAERVREFLFSAMLVFNAIIGLTAFALVYGSTAALVLSSGETWRRRSG